MPRGRTLVWTIIGSVIAAVAVAIALIHASSGTPSKAASSPAPPGSAGARTQSSKSAPVVVPPEPTGTSSFSYLSDLRPAGGLGEQVNPGPVKISGSIYPKSISFYCNVGDPTPFPAYTLKHNARRFQATLGLPANMPHQFKAAVLLDGDGRTLRTFSVSALKPKTVDVSVKGVHTLRLECFGSGNSYTGGEAIALEWGNARVSGGR
jgi:NPCBM/NEW2 domain-containing protein